MPNYFMLAVFPDVCMLQVQWDEATSIVRPDRVSPWEIEPFDAPVPALNALQPVFVKNKRPRQSMDIVDHPLLGKQDF